MAIKCKVCGDTGSTSEFGYLDCIHCGAAQERHALELWSVSNCKVPLSDDDLWTVYQHGKEAARKESSQ